jgi:nicotinamidase-related amidase
MLTTKFEEIVDRSAIGNPNNTRNLNEILRSANKENLKPATSNKEQVLVIGIDMQQDFMENGALGVPGSHKDVENFTQFIYNNLDEIAQIAISIDTHNPFQIFHPCWWVDANGVNPPPFTVITLADLDSGKWMPVINPLGSREYVENLEKHARKTLVIWTYHCLQGTSGASLENQFSNMVYFHSVAKKTVVQRLVKGQDPMTEMYGIIKAEYDVRNYINMDFLNKIEKFDKIIIAGEAKSHCVLESIRQILEHYANRPDITSKVYVLEDCMSNITGFEQPTVDAFNAFKRQYNINIVNSVDLKL